MSRSNCECADPRCPAHKGATLCFGKQNLTLLYRVDTTDQTGTLFCEQCRDDALTSELYSLVLELEENDESIEDILGVDLDSGGQA